MEAEESSSSVVPLPQDVQSVVRGGFRCLLCGVNIPNRPSLTDHLSGRRHVRLHEERDKRNQQQERSVYVSNFPRETSEEQLRDVFQKISPVRNIVMDKDRGLYAIVEFESKDGMCAALEEPQIKLSGKRLRVKPREKKEFQRKKGGSPRTLQPPDPEALSKELLNCADVEQQIKKLVSLCSPSHHESHLRELLLSLLQETFTEFFPGCQLLPFGSSVNGFEISGCDLDLYLDLGDDEAENVEGKAEKEIQNREESSTDMEVSMEDPETERKEEEMEIGNSKNDEDEDVTPGLSLKGLSSEEILEVVGKVLRHCVPGVHGVQSVPTARRPVIHFQHKTSGLRGDVTLNNRLALRNSSFLRLCSDLDARVPQLVYTVRYWARVNQLAGNPFGGGPLLNNYALTLLVFFFLQTRNPPVLPTLVHLREETANEVPQVIDGWDCSFPSDPAQVKESGNQQSLSSLLSEFFSFYASLDLHLLILCPCNGLTIPLPFSSPPPAWSEGFRLGPLNIQDPFELSHNVCGNVSSRAARRFISHCAAAARICRTPNYNLHSTSHPWGITPILLPPPTERECVGRGGTEISIPLGGVSPEKTYAAVSKVFVDVLLCTLEEGREDSCQEGKALELSTKHAKAQCKVEKNEVGGELGEQEVPCKAEQNNTKEASKQKSIFKTEEGMTESARRKREMTEPCMSDMTNGKKRRLEFTRGIWDHHLATSAMEEEMCGEAHKDSKTKIDYSNNGTAQWELLVWHRVWEGRRKERRRKQKGEADGVELEIAVSQALALEKEDKCDGPLMKLILTAQLTVKESLQLYLTPKFDPQGLSSTFFHFLESYLPRMVAQIQGCGDPV
uniref:Speckle targeted PIP5K1A-regulated poly(A) polymerase n=1 Tax=Xenopus tropicalis TaxID=8364 RepID=STPAP_XENTR|eukprot:XP_002941502.2 PREDICTED: speckle targeted PIP5K1A-regulated poly(A) polymerase isoform X1 [Xenopus tropicalis]